MGHLNQRGFYPVLQVCDFILDVWLHSPIPQLGFYLWFENISGEGYVTYSIILAGKTPWREESGVIQSMQLQRVEYGLVTKLQYFNGSVHISSVQISHSVMSNSL